MAGLRKGARIRRISKPTVLNTVRKRNKEESKEVAAPRPKTEIPKPPATLDAVALEEWKVITEHLAKYKLIAKVDRYTIAMYCDAVSMWIFAGEKINTAKEKNIVIQGKKGGGQYRSPWFDIRQKAQQDIIKYSALLGLSAGDRSRLKTGTPDPDADEDNPFAKI